MTDDGTKYAFRAWAVMEDGGFPVSTQDLPLAIFGTKKDATTWRRKHGLVDSEVKQITLLLP